jgi:cobalt-zinc-cadmium efflux system outer membrane protein
MATAIVALAGCASTSAQGGFEDVQGRVEKRTGHRIFWNQGTEADRKVERMVRGMLADTLTLPEAVQIALLNNRRLQSEYEELSVAQADLVQAGLLSNPMLSGGLGFPVEGGAPDIDLGVELDFLSLLFIPARKRLAGAQLELAKSRVGDEVLAHAAEVKRAYYQLQAAVQVAALERVIAAAGQAGSELATGQFEAGNISELDMATQRSLYENARLRLARTEAEVVDHREELNRLMGLWGADTAWRIPERLPELPAQDPSLERLESVAVEQRLDIAAARDALSLASMGASLGSSGRWIGGLDVGAEAEREEGEWKVGPTASLGLPLFDQGQAVVARAEAELRRARHRLAWTSVNARSEVRQVRSRLIAARSVADHYRKVLVPLRERMVALAQQQYDAMLIGVYQLLETKQDEVDAYREYVESVRDYWLARADLERAVGGRLPAGPSTRAPSPQKPPAAAPPAQPPTGSQPHRH